MLADSFVERNSIILKNINDNAQTEPDVWYSGTGYGYYGIPYSDYLILDHYYYLRCQYKFTTTNKSPTWCTMYFQGGGGGGGPSVSNPIAGTEYTLSGIRQPVITNSSAPISSGTMYNGESNAISGVTSYVKNCLVYDVTDLYYLLKANNVVTTTDALKTWCDTNLVFKARRVPYDITSLVTSAINNVTINKGAVIANEFVEADGMEYYSVSAQLRNNTYFDTGSGVSIYNNSSNGTVTHTRVDAAAQGSPFYPTHKYVLKIQTNGTASPGAGGLICTHIAAANKIFIEKIVAKIPIGYTLVAAYNSQGTGSAVTYTTSMAGTGNWQEYGILYKCGSGGSFSTGGHLYLNGPNNTNVVWYVAYANSCEITNNEALKNFSILNNKLSIKGGTLSTDKLDETNLLPNGDGSDTNATMLSSGWTYDTTDIAGNAKASIVQPVGAATGYYGLNLSIDPNSLYKISYWVKCKADMTSFLTAIIYKRANGSEFNHTNTVWVPGTKTTLSAPLSSGDMSMTVASAANWKAKSYSRIGFRSGSTWSCPTYNDKGTSNAPSGSTGMIASVSGNTVNFNTAYTGSTMPTGTVVVESYDGATFPYPIGKGNLPTDNTWKYVEGYFGANNVVWEGAGNGWEAIPQEARYMDIRLNLYSNNGSVPIKYADIRVESVGSHNGHRREHKIQIKKED